MNYKAIIFDLDGTIIDTDHVWRRARNQIISNRGHELTPEDEAYLDHHLAGMDTLKSCQIIKDLIQTDDSVEILMKEKIALACQLYQTSICFIEGFIEFHAKARAIPLKMGVATNANAQTVMVTEKKLNLTHYFEHHIYTINHVDNRGKPDPAIYLYAAKQLGVAPKECIAIEDSAHGILAAQLAGMLCIGINSSKKPEQIEKADITVNGYHEIILDKLLYSYETTATHPE